MDFSSFQKIVKPGEPVTAHLLAQLESRLPAVACEMLNTVLNGVGKGERMDHLFIEKNGVIGSTEFSPISNDSSNVTQLFYRTALSQLGVTSAAAVCEAISRNLDPGEIIPRPDAPGRDIIMVIWWEKGRPGGMWGFGVEGKRPGPRKLLQESAPSRTMSRFEGLLEPADIVSMMVPNMRASANEELVWLRGMLGDLVAPKTAPTAPASAPKVATVQ